MTTERNNPPLDALRAACSRGEPIGAIPQAQSVQTARGIWYQVDDIGDKAERHTLESARRKARALLDTQENVRVYGFDDTPGARTEFWIHADISWIYPEGRFPTSL